MSSPSSRKADRVEWLGIGFFTLLGAILRFWNFGRLGLTHFDEGIYASSGIWSLAPDGLSSLDPGVLSYAPPGFPILVGLAYSLLGVADSSAIFVSIVVGSLTIPLIGWLGRRLLGRGGGVASAALASLALVHIAFSRKALTDVSFLATWLLAIGLGSRFLERPNFVRGIAMGLAVGLAQNFKYNGWIAGVIIFVAAVFGVIQDREERKPGRVARTFGFGLVGAAVAIALYLLWFRFVDEHGGYSALLAHQRSYMGGLSTWLPHLFRQLEQGYLFSGGIFWGLLKGALAMAAVAIVLRAADPSPPISGALRDYGGLLGKAVLSSILFVAYLQFEALTTALTLVIALFPPRGFSIGVFRPFIPTITGEVSYRIFVAWWLVLFAMTPFYHPYARLWLPLHSLSWLMMAALIVSMNRESGGMSHPRLTLGLRHHSFERSRVFVVLTVLLFGMSLAMDWNVSGRLRPGAVTAFFQPTDSLRNAVTKVAAPGIEGKPLGPEGVSLKVLGRRPVVFYLGVLGQVPFRVLADRSQILEGTQPPNEWLLIDSVQFDREGSSEETWPLVLDRWKRVDSWPIPLDPVTLFDEQPSSWKSSEGETPRLWLFAPMP